MSTYFAIIGKRSNGETLHYCLSNHSPMVPNGYSMAILYPERETAVRQMRKLERDFKGLVFSIERRREA